MIIILHLNKHKMNDLEKELLDELIAVLSHRLETLIAKRDTVKTQGDPVPVDPTHPKPVNT